MFTPPTNGLPDPMFAPAFYDGVAVKRLVAWAVDTVVVVLLTAVIVPFTAFIALFFLPLLFLAVNFVYRTVTLARMSATPGMWLAGIELRDGAGAVLTPGLAVAHTLGYSLSIGFVVPQVASVVLMLMTPRGQGLSDHVLGTAAINRPAARG